MVTCRLCCRNNTNS